ncbi:hypothetical protein JTB14_038119 [Gonioctena quinquepunctata]|nr:hypothetical protein JTB14_038119 [Gonioctena quinquepunctata]
MIGRNGGDVIQGSWDALFHRRDYSTAKKSIVLRYWGVQWTVLSKIVWNVVLSALLKFHLGRGIELMMGIWTPRVTRTVLAMRKFGHDFSVRWYMLVSFISRHKAEVWVTVSASRS